MVTRALAFCGLFICVIALSFEDKPRAFIPPKGFSGLCVGGGGGEV